MQKHIDSLSSLQNLMRRDPDAYREEFRQQYQNFQANYELLQMRQMTHEQSKQFGKQVTFLAHVAPSFPKECGLFPGQILKLLKERYESIVPNLRVTLTQCVILLQNRGMLPRMEVLPILFYLFRARDKKLRKMLFSHIVNDIKRICTRKRFAKVNKALQGFMFSMLKDENATAAKKSLDVMVELWRRNLWRDPRVVNAISFGCFHKDHKILTGALRFFLGMNTRGGDDPDDGNARWVWRAEKRKELMEEYTRNNTSLKGVKKKKKRERELRKAMSKIKKLERQDAASDDEEEMLGSSVQISNDQIRMLNDPLTFAEKLFGMCKKKSAHTFQTRLLLLNVISRVIGFHKLQLLNFFPYLQDHYLKPFQPEITKLLVYLAQASHTYIPEDYMRPVIRHLANEFVNDRSPPEVMAVGINSIREVCARAPFAMTPTLLSDLVRYKRSKHRSVAIAARSLVSLFQDVCPEMLEKKERGRTATMAIREAGSDKKQVDDEEFSTVGSARTFWQHKVHKAVPGSDLLLQSESKSEPQLERKGAPSLRIYSDEDFKKMRRLRLMHALQNRKNISEEEKVVLEKLEKNYGQDGLLGQKRGRNDDQGDNVRPNDEASDSDSGDGEDAIDAEASESGGSDVDPGLRRMMWREGLDVDDYTRVLDGDAYEPDLEVDEGDIAAQTRKKKLPSKEQRRALALEKRNERLLEKHGAPKETGGGTTNLDKEKHKPFHLMKHSYKVRAKVKAPMHEKFKTFGSHVKNMRRYAKKRKRNVGS